MKKWILIAILILIIILLSCQKGGANIAYNSFCGGHAIREILCGPQVACVKSIQVSQRELEAAEKPWESSP